MMTTKGCRNETAVPNITRSDANTGPTASKQHPADEPYATDMRTKEDAPKVYASIGDILNALNGTGITEGDRSRVTSE